MIRNFDSGATIAPRMLGRAFLGNLECIPQGGLALNNLAIISCDDNRASR